MCRLYTINNLWIQESYWEFAPNFWCQPLLAYLILILFICLWADTKSSVETSDVPESFLSSQSHEPFESESYEIVSSRVGVESQEWPSHFE